MQICFYSCIRSISVVKNILNDEFFLLIFTLFRFVFFLNKDDKKIAKFLFKKHSIKVYFDINKIAFGKHEF